jgi:hypothetical protein
MEIYEDLFLSELFDLLSNLTERASVSPCMNCLVERAIGKENDECKNCSWYLESEKKKKLTQLSELTRKIWERIKKDGSKEEDSALLFNFLFQKRREIESAKTLEDLGKIRFFSISSITITQGGFQLVLKLAIRD